MGTAVSKYSDLLNNTLVARFCSNEAISPNDPFWNKLLAYNITLPKCVDDQLALDSAVEVHMQQFLINNLQTGNLGSLMQVFMTRATELLASPTSDSAMLAWQTFNALHVVRCCIKYLVEMVPEYVLVQHLDALQDSRRQTDEGGGVKTPPLPEPSTVTEAAPSHSLTNPVNPTLTANRPSTSKNQSSESRLEMLCDALVGLICDVPVTDNTYYLMLECTNTMLVLLSVYMFAGVHGQVRMPENSIVYRTLFQGRYGLQASTLVRTLLQNVINMVPAPTSMFGCSDSGGSIVLDLAASIWNIFTLQSEPRRRDIFSDPPVTKKELKQRLLTEHPVANQSCLLLLALTTHCYKDNLYRRALVACEDAAEAVPRSPPHAVGIRLVPPRVEMAMLHKTFCATANTEEFTLLIYLMLHSCPVYHRHVTQASNHEDIMLPMLKCLYETKNVTSQHSYMLLIVLLILTEDDHVAKVIHEIMLPSPPWYNDHSLGTISLGGLTVLVLLRTVQRNIGRVRDRYLHTNCLAMLSNMSNEFRNLHQYPAQRIVSLLDILTKRKATINRVLSTDRGAVGGVNFNSLRETSDEDLNDHLSVLDEVIQMLLEIINAIICNQLQHNINFIYALLQSKTIFTFYKDVKIVNNIDMVIGFFTSRLQRVQEGVEGALVVEDVLEVIRKGCEQWSSDRLKKFPDLKFRYQEEDRPEDFFTPYVWTLVSKRGTVYWASEGGQRARRDMELC